MPENYKYEIKVSKDVAQIHVRSTRAISIGMSKVTY